ncbi:phosphoesterase [Telmatobacter bradus]|uniref:phosphoesterase n=1 Tax=Telmatobacter bradus TaxID=474953 RepID=UPI003B428223
MKILSLVSVGWAITASCAAQSLDLPTSKQLVGELPGHPQRLNSLPISMAVSPDGRYVVSVNAGYGTFESNYDQSLAVLDSKTGELADFPDARTLTRVAKQTLYSGLAFSRDGATLYVSMASLSDPEGNGKDRTGSGIAVYSFKAGKVAPEKILPLPMVELSGNRRTNLVGNKPGTKGVPYPAAIAVVGVAGREKLLVAENLTDDVVLLDPATGAVEQRFDLAESDAIPSTYPVALAVAKDGKRAFVAQWNASEIVELNLEKNTVGRRLPLLKPPSEVAPGTHPCAFEFAPDGRTLYVALANRDAVAAVNVAAGEFAVKGYFDTRLPQQSYFGAEPVALAASPDGARIYVANAASDAVAVLDAHKLTAKVAKQTMVEPDGFIPTEWMPMTLALTGGKLYIATAKGHGTGPNNLPQLMTGLMLKSGEPQRKTTYIATLLYGSLATLELADVAKKLPAWTESVIASNRMKAAEEKVVFAGGATGKIKHVLYIIKENRTYDQIFGDLERNGKPVGNGDKSLTMYGAAITPNLHKLALQFGVLDNFFDSGEVSGDGHVWSMAAIGSDYLEKTWQQSYRGGQRTYDYEGVVAQGYPLLQKIPDVNEPASGYLWGNAEAHGRTHYNFGEYIASAFCGESGSDNPQLGPVLAGPKCVHSHYAPGEALPENWGGGVNQWPWPIPVLAGNTPTKPELVGHYAEESPDFELSIPDQIRASVFLRHLQGWIEERKAGQDTMPNLIVMRLGNDHTAGTQPGGPTPSASIADNDLAAGRIVEGISHSAYWDDTAIFMLEDDAQAGGDHVDAHRSIALVISKYAPRAAAGGPVVDSRFYSTVSVIRTIESLLDLPPMNNNDAFASLIGSLFTGTGDQPAFAADTANRDNGLIYKANQKNAVGAKASMKMDFRHEDRAPVEKLNVILWKDAMGSQPVPAMLKVHVKADKDDD